MYILLRRKIAIFGIVGLIAVMLLLFIVYRHGSSDTPPRQQTAQERADELITEASSPEGSVSQSSERLNRALTEAASEREKAVYYEGLVELYSTNEQGERSLEAAERYERDVESATSAALLAYSYRDRGDFAASAQFFQLAADRSERTDDPSLDTPYNNYLIEKRVSEQL